MMLVVHEQEFIARPGIRKAHAAWVTGGAPVGFSAHGVLRGQLRVGECEQMGEALRRQAGNSEIHDVAPYVGSRPIWRTSDFEPPDSCSPDAAAPGHPIARMRDGDPASAAQSGGVSPGFCDRSAVAPSGLRLFRCALPGGSCTTA